MNNFRLLTAVGGLAYVAVGMSSPLVTLYLESLGADYAHISLILTSFVVMLLVGNALWGRISDRLGRRKPLLVGGLAGLGLAYTLLSQAPNVQWAWGTRLLEGLFMAAYTTLSLAIMGDLLEGQGTAGRNRKGRAMGIYRGIGSFCFALGAMVGGRLADAYSLSVTFIGCALLYGLAAGTALFLEEGRGKEAQPAPRPQAQPASPPAWIRARALPYAFLAGVLCWTAAHAMSASMWPNYMASLGYSKTALSSLWALAALVEMPAMYAAGALSDLTGRATLLAAGGFGIALVNLGYIIVAHLFPALLGVQVLRGFGFGSYTASAMTFTAEAGEQRTRGSNSGLFFSAASAGQLLGMFLGGTLAQFWGFATMYSVCVALALASAACFLWLRAHTPHPSQVPSGA